jgi:tetratricopeptide (TPR) repeat protein
LGKQPLEALRAFERVRELLPDSASAEEDAGVACLEAGLADQAAAHLERAITLDPLLLSASTALQEVYKKQGKPEKATALSNRVRLAMGGR